MVYLYLSIESGSYSYTTSGLTEVLAAMAVLLECVQKSRTSRVITLRFIQCIFYRRTEYFSTGGIIGRYSSELSGGKWYGAKLTNQTQHNRSSSIVNMIKGYCRYVCCVRSAN
jgi:hypothetical protein